MKNIFYATFIFLLSISSLRAQDQPYIQWQKCLGGSSGDEANSIQQTTDGGFIVAGRSVSSDGDVSQSFGGNDVWIVKIDTAGDIIWEKSFGGSTWDEARCIQQTNNGGFIVAGHSNSNDGDVTGNHGNDDYWIVNLDSAGNLVWQKSFGGSGDEEAYSIQQTNDGGFIVAGWSNSNDSDVTGNHGNHDFWIIKLDSIGNLIWQKSFGGSNEDDAHSIQQTMDGGYLVTGASRSNDGDVTGNHGDDDFWVVKLDLNGGLVWQKCFGGTYVEYGHSGLQTPYGNFIIAGWTGSVDGDVSGNNGSADYWIIKLDSNGNLTWQKCLGGTDGDMANYISLTKGDGFIVTGSSISDDGDVSENNGLHDYWVSKLDSTGNLEWQKSLGGSSQDDAYCIQQTADDGFIVAGVTHSSDGDISNSHGNDDYWIVKLGVHVGTQISSAIASSVSIFPNPVNETLYADLQMTFNEVRIKLYDMSGRIIYLPVSFYNTTIEINTKSLRSGIYVLEEINTKTGEIKVSKFVKE